MSDKNIVISTKSIIIFFVILFVFWVLWLIKGVIITLFIAIILALALEPAVKWFTRKKVPHALAVFLIIFLFLGVILGLASFAISPLIVQTKVLIQNLPIYIDSLFNMPGAEEYAKRFNDALFQQISQASGNVVTATMGAFSSALSIVVLLAFTVYLLIDFDSFREFALSFAPKNKKSDLRELVRTIEVQLGSWLRAQAFLMFIIGTATYIGLTILGIDYALALAVLAGLLEIIPIIGPITAVIPAAIIGFSISPLMGFAVIGLYILIQQLENNLIVPKVMQKSVGFNPLFTIIILLIGSKLMGVIGVLIAIPTTIVFFEVIKYLLNLDIQYFERFGVQKGKRENILRKLNLFKEEVTLGPDED